MKGRSGRVQVLCDFPMILVLWKTCLFFLCAFSNHTSNYIQVWNGNENSCQTSYYIAEIDYTIPPIEIEECSYHNGIEWLPLEKLYTAFSFNKKILSDLEFLIAQVSNNREALK